MGPESLVSEALGLVPLANSELLENSLVPQLLKVTVRSAKLNLEMFRFVFMVWSYLGLKISPYRQKIGKYLEQNYIKLNLLNFLGFKKSENMIFRRPLESPPLKNYCL